MSTNNIIFNDEPFITDDINVSKILFLKKTPTSW